MSTLIIYCARLLMTPRDAWRMCRAIARIHIQISACVPHTIYSYANNLSLLFYSTWLQIYIFCTAPSDKSFHNFARARDPRGLTRDRFPVFKHTVCLVRLVCGKSARSLSNHDHQQHDHLHLASCRVWRAEMLMRATNADDIISSIHMYGTTIYEIQILEFAHQSFQEDEKSIPT